jgi:hypothetical protein
MTILCVYTNKEDSESTYESKCSLEIVDKMQHWANVNKCSHCSLVMERKPEVEWPTEGTQSISNVFSGPSKELGGVDVIVSCQSGQVVEPCIIPSSSIGGCCQNVNATSRGCGCQTMVGQ